jgi:hypothetical protein
MFLLRLELQYAAHHAKSGRATESTSMKQEKKGGKTDFDRSDSFGKRQVRIKGRLI